MYTRILTAREVNVTEAFSVVLAIHCKGKGTAVPVHSMKACRGVYVLPYSFLTSALVGGEWSGSCPG